MSTAALSSHGSVFVLEGGQSKQTASPADSLDREHEKVRERKSEGWGTCSGGARECELETLRRGRRECEVWQPVLQTAGFYSGSGLWFPNTKKFPLFQRVGGDKYFWIWPWKSSQRVTTKSVEQDLTGSYHESSNSQGSFDIWSWLY